MDNSAAPEEAVPEQNPYDDHEAGYSGEKTTYMVCHDGSEASVLALHSVS